MRLVTADDLCVATQELLKARVPGIITAMEWEDKLRTVKTWQQVPDLAALTAANTPAAGITSPGLVDVPNQSHSRGHAATWRIVAGMFDRGTDHADTAQRARRWAAVIRAALIDEPTLGGVAERVTWAGEEYDELPDRRAARTIAGCAVSFNVTANNVVDFSTGSALLPVVISTHELVTVRSPE